VFRLQRLDGACDPDPGGVDEHVHAAEAVPVRGDDANAVVLLAHVRGDRVRAEGVRRRLDLLARARGERQLVALVAQQPGDREPDPGRSPRDERARHGPTIEDSAGRTRTLDA
jgi:hypothetical protein